MFQNKKKLMQDLGIVLLVILLKNWIRGFFELDEISSQYFPERADSWPFQSRVKFSENLVVKII